jgi:ATP-dependent helicase/nuclease subunit A
VPARPLTPSRPDGAEPPVRSPIGGDDGARFRRGRLIHRLFQSLPELDPGRREEAAVRFLTRRGWGLSSQEQADIAAEVRAVLTHPNFAPLFGPGSRAEVPLAGLLGGRAITGQIDRLRVTDDAVQIVDFKSNRPPPLTVEGVADIYLRQMATYRGLLAKIYPARSITCMLLWTDGPNLMILPESLLNKAAAALGL